MKYIQSFYQYPVTFSSIAKTLPARGASGEMRNLCEITDAQYDTLMRCEPLFRELVKNKKYRVLNKMPDSYKSSASQINEARQEADKFREENERLRAELAAAKKGQDEADIEVEPGVTATDNVGEDDDITKLDYKELQEVAKKLGIENVNVKKSVLIEAIENAKK